MTHRSVITRAALAAAFILLIAGALRAQTIVHVDVAAPGGGDGLSWLTAFDDLQEAFAYANTQPMVQEIWVRSGVYRPGTARTDAFRPATGKGIYGGFAGHEFLRTQRDVEANPTILTGDVGSALPAYHVVDASNLASTTILDGFIIEGGFANGPVGSGNDRGAGMLINNSSIRVQRCILRGNTTGAGRLGGAVFIDGDSSPRFTRCVFEDNSVGSGGAGGAANVRGIGNTRFTNCIFRDNTAVGGTGVGGAVATASTGTVTLTNCILSANVAGVGGALYATAAGPVRVINSTLHANDATTTGGIANAGGDVTVRNTILWLNTDSSGATETAQISAVAPSINTSITYCLIDGLTTLTSPGNFDADPRFADAAGPDDQPGTADDNLHLVVPSPCIDSGNNLAVGADLVDLDNDGDSLENLPLDLDDGPRFTDDPGTTDTGLGTPPIVDIGAFEFDPGQRLLVEPQFIHVPEGDSAIFTVALNLAPAGPTTVTVTRIDGDTDLAVSSGATLDFTAANFGTPQNVVIAAAQDADFANGQATFRVSAAGLASVDVIAQEVDDEILPGNVRVVSSAAPPGGSGLAWSVAYHRLEDALAEAASSGGKVTDIWVAGGVYRPSTVDPDASFTLPAGVRVFGGFAGDEVDAALRNPTLNPTILTGDLDGGVTRARHVVRADGVGNATLLEGFVIQAGDADGAGDSHSARGGALLCINASPVIRHCIFQHNVAAAHAGAVAIEGGAPVFIACDFIDNAAPAGGALADSPDSAARLFNCRFIANRADGGIGGALLLSGTPRLFNTIISGNHASRGAGLFVDSDGQVTAANVTLASNEATLAGAGALVAGGAILSFENSILWANRDASGEGERAQVDATFGSVSLTRCCVLGLTGDLGGLDNTGADPRFIDRAGPDGLPGTLDDDLRLFAGSPCIDAGRAGALPVDDAFDLDGDGDLAERTPRDVLGRERFIDDPLIDDRGAGSPAWVDLGAAEWLPGDAGSEWVNPAGGTWTTLTNWRPDAPDAADPMTLWADGAYAIEVPVSIDVQAVAAEAGDVRLSLNGATLTALDGAAPVLVGARGGSAPVTLRIDNGEVLSARGVIGAERSTGTVIIEGATGAWTVAETIDIRRGDLSVGALGVSAGSGVDVATDGRLLGAGAIHADVRALGVISPDGALAIGGDLLLAPGPGAGALCLDIDAIAPDHVTVGGLATLAGLLHLRPGPDAPPGIGAQVALLSANALADAPDAIVVPHLGAQARYAVSIDSAAINAVVDAHADRIAFAPLAPFALIGTPNAVVDADVDGDGDRDLVAAIPALVSANPGRVVYIENRGRDAGTQLWNGMIPRAPVLVGAEPVAMDVGALDDAPGLDVVTADRTGHRLSILSWNGVDAFAPAAVLSGDFRAPRAVVARDLTGDGRADLVAIAAAAPDEMNLDPGGQGVLLTWENLGGTPPSFALIESRALGADPRALAADDLDGDGSPDVVVAAASPSRLLLLPNLGNGALADALSTPLPHVPDALRLVPLAPGDPAARDMLTFSQAGDSLAWTTHQGGMAWRSAGAVHLDASPVDGVSGDVDEDGDVDLLLARAGASVEVWRNDASPASPRLLAAGGAVAATPPVARLALADLDGDGRLDLASFADQATPEGAAGAVTVLLNAAPPPCPPDVTDDGLADFDDLNLVLVTWGAAGPPWTGADADGSGHIDFDDLNMVLLNWGKGCTP